MLAHEFIKIAFIAVMQIPEWVTTNREDILFEF